jgi:hypothetical protein
LREKPGFCQKSAFFGRPVKGPTGFLEKSMRTNIDLDDTLVKMDLYDPVDWSWRIDFGSLLKQAANGRRIIRAILTK